MQIKFMQLEKHHVSLEREWLLQQKTGKETK